MADESRLVVYGAPFLGVLLLAVGIAGGVLGGYSAIQEDLDLCGDPTIEVYSEEATNRLTSGDAPHFVRLSVEELTHAERRAFFRALEDPKREARIRGEVRHLQAFRQGVIVEYRGGERYVTLLSMNSCVGVSPLLLPLGLFAILLGVGGVLTPPIYRRIAAFEDRPSEPSE